MSPRMYWEEPVEFTPEARARILHELQGNPQAEAFVDFAEAAATHCANHAAHEAQEPKADEHRLRLARVAELADDLRAALQSLPPETADWLARGQYGARPWRRETMHAHQLDPAFAEPLRVLADMACWADAAANPGAGRPAKRHRLFLVIRLAGAWRNVTGNLPSAYRGPFDRVLETVLQALPPEFHLEDRRDLVRQALAELLPQ